MVSDTALDFTSDPTRVISPGSTATVVFTTPIGGGGTNDAIVTGSPTLRDGSVIPELDSVSDTDPSAVELLPFEPSITIDNTVRECRAVSVDHF